MCIRDRSKVVAVVLLAVAALLIPSVAGAEAVRTPEAPAPAVGAVASSLIGATYEPITPCRIVDTRQAGGRFDDREIRDYRVTGEGQVFADQGGKAGGCDIPSGVSAVEASITAVDPLDSGFFRAWPTGESMPNATFMNFDEGMDITNTCLLYTSPSPRDLSTSRMPSSA